MKSSNKFQKKMSDHIFSLVKATSELDPSGCAGFLVSLLSDYIPTSVEKRKEKLLIQLDKDIKMLMGKFKEEVLTKEYFITTFMESFSSALRTHQKEKIEAYRAIILNTLTSISPNEDEIAVFISITQRLTPLHIKILKILADPNVVVDQNPEIKSKIESVALGSLYFLLSHLLPGFSQELMEVAFKDLYSMGFHTTPSFGGSMSKHGMLAKRISGFGEKYLSFITLPVDF